MERFEHGGDIYTHEGAIDFSANLNPLGMPQAVKDALRDNVEHFDAYPDLECRELRKAIAQAEGVSEDMVLCTAGATDLMQRVCLALASARRDTLDVPGEIDVALQREIDSPRDGAAHIERALVTAPCFSGYEEALEQACVPIVRHVLLEEEGFNVTERFVGDVAENPHALVFLCNPNNPTGLTVDRDLIVRVVRAAREAESIVVLDECFLDFTHEPSMVPLCREHPNLVVMRAFTKMYAIAGLRLGYGICSDADFLGRVRAAGQPWAVSTPAQVAGVAALSVEGWAKQTRAYVDAERERLASGLHSLGLRVIDGKANYLMFQCRGDLYEPLLQRGFLIRRCENYQGLDSSWFRIAVRTASENEAFMQALADVQ